MYRVHSRPLIAAVMLAGLLVLGLLALPQLRGDATPADRTAQVAAIKADPSEPTPVEVCHLPIGDPPIENVAYRRQLAAVKYCVSVRVKVEKKDKKYILKIDSTTPDTIKAAEALELRPDDVGARSYEVRVLLPEFTTASGFTCTAPAAGAVVPARQIGSIGATVSAPAAVGTTFTATAIDEQALVTDIILYTTCTKP